MGKKLVDQEVQAYEERGFLDVPDLLDKDEITELRQRIEDIAELRMQGFPKDQIELEPGADGVYSLQTVRKLNACAENDTVLMQYAKSEKVLDVVQALLGPDLKLYSSQAFMKPPGGVEKPYHQDSAYFSIEPMALATCWIALDDVTVENGCLRVIPGSHRNGVLPHSEKWVVGDKIDMRIPASAFDSDTEVPITMHAGSCSIHHSLLLHCSRPNQTRHSRRGLAFHYMTAKSRWTDPEQPKPDYQLLRGREFPGCV